MKSELNRGKSAGAAGAAALAGLLATLVWGVGAGEKQDTQPTAPRVPAVEAKTNQVIAYYFHVTVRCETCLKIEKQAREAIERRFKVEMTAKRLVFKVVNFELPENAHFLGDYKLPCPSLVLVWQQDGKDQKWQLLGDTWKLVEDAEKFNKYVETEVDKFLRDAKYLP